jgi:uroporphyrin-III C-methyltransferase/precorrin-2 dehydrogenase/sirohydrochlorin ferrochelatase/uroporphyrin-III C-methyltransferase
MSTEQNKGKVILAGAGPGDPELLTLKTLRYLQGADVVLTDRLVSAEILNCYVNPRAEIIYVGKQCRKGSSTPQSSINDLMIGHAASGKLVVRLKGGDVSIFSNILDELQVLSDNNIPYEIIPGVTAALGAAAYSGIPLTARGFSTAVRFVTYYRSDVVTEEYWKELANTNDTLVFYMSAETLGSVVKNLLANNISEDKKLAVIGQATTPQQRVVTCSLREYEQKIGHEEYISPTIAIIGKVVKLNEQFAWIKNNEAPEEYFKQLAVTKLESGKEQLTIKK